MRPPPRQEVTPVVGWQEIREPALDDTQAVLRELQIPDHLGIEQRHRVRRHRVAKARMEFFRHRRATDDVTPFEHDDLQSRRREIRRTHEPVVPAADDQRITGARRLSLHRVRLNHVTAPRRKS